MQNSAAPSTTVVRPTILRRWAPLYRGKMAILGKILNCTKSDLSFNCDCAIELDFAADVQANTIKAKIEISSPAAAPTLPSRRDRNCRRAKSRRALCSKRHQAVGRQCKLRNLQTSLPNSPAVVTGARLHVPLAQRRRPGPWCRTGWRPARRHIRH
jgi:hypothetical protein